MTTVATAVALGQTPAFNADSAEIVAQELVYTAPAALVAGDIIKLGFLPAGHKPVDFTVDTASLLDLGLLNTAGTAIDTTAASGGAAWGAGIAAGLSRMSTSAAIRTVTAKDTNRVIGAVLGAGLAQGATVRVLVFYRAGV